MAGGSIASPESLLLRSRWPAPRTTRVHVAAVAIWVLFVVAAVVALLAFVHQWAPAWHPPGCGWPGTYGPDCTGRSPLP